MNGQYVQPIQKARTTARVAMELRSMFFGVRPPRQGTSKLTKPAWDGSNDPLFTDALEVVADVLGQGPEYEWENKKPFFRLQMAYLLLWSAIERYASLRYGLRGTKGDTKPYQKRNALAAEDAFQDGIEDEIPDRRNGHILYRTDRPQISYELSQESAENTIDYYYQVRSNLTQRQISSDGIRSREGFD